jgi:hypothetical protein
VPWVWFGQETVSDHVIERAGSKKHAGTMARHAQRLKTGAE